MTRSALISCFVCLFGVCVAQAVMIRHNVSDKKYVDHAAKPEFQAGCITILDNRGDYTGVLIADQFVLTAGHPVVWFLKESENDGAVSLKVRHGDNECEVDYIYLHPQYDRDKHHGGTDLAVFRLKSPGLPKVTPAKLWIGDVTCGDRFVGVGQGKSGTGRDNDEPKKPGTFRGYENKIDYISDDNDFRSFRADFDNGIEDSNTLARVVYAKKHLQIKGKSSKSPLPLEGSLAAGDSGGGIWVLRDKRYYLVGIASFRYFAAYGAQSGYANLSHPVNVEWLKDVGRRENIEFEMSNSK